MTIAAPLQTAVKSTRKQSRSLAELLAPLERIAATSPNLVANHDARFEVDGESYELPRYLFVGPRGGDTPIRVGIFAGVHGDEPEGVHALVQFIKLLEAKPELATGYYLSFYPVCNPTGFEDNTRHSRAGKDLNREFWRSSAEPEVRLLQAELISRSFQGIISLHTDDTSAGFYGFAHGAMASYRLTFGASFLAALVNAFFGLIVAWVLVRYRFFGKRLVDALVDLPFALPTAVAGITLATLYARTAGSAMARAARHQGRHTPLGRLSSR
jgi:hypothetical protein